MDFNSGKALLDLCSSENKKISDIMMLREENEGGLSHEENIKKITKSINIMRNSVLDPLTNPVKSIGGMIGGEAEKLQKYYETQTLLCGPVLSKAMVYAMAVLETNASMGLIVAAPTAGSSGVVPGILLSASEEYKKTDEELYAALFNAAAIGYLLMRNSSVSGAEAGCQAEVGSASAMAASALTELMGGTPHMCLNAAALAISNLLGLVCDPIAGLVECPCQTRNVIGAANAITSAQVSLSGVNFPIPFDEMADTMKRVGMRLPFELRETALGGCAITPTGQRVSAALKI